MAGLHLGIDWGGTNVKWALVGDGGAAVVAHGSEPTDREGGVRVVDQLAALAARHAGEATTVGIGVPGAYDPRDGSLRRVVNVPGDWAGVPLAARIAEAAGVRAAMVNDGRACTLAEHRLGAGRGTRTMLCLVIGTGVGGGLVVDGHLHLAGDGAAGEVGHQPVDPDGPPCTCGSRGCLERYVAAAPIAAAAGCATAAEADLAARAGDARAVAAWAHAGAVLGRAVVGMALLAMPERIVVGGGVAEAGDLLLDPVRAALASHSAVARLDLIEVVGARLGPLAGAIGAALHGADPRGHGVAVPGARAG